MATCLVEAAVPRQGGTVVISQGYPRAQGPALERNAMRGRTPEHRRGKLEAMEASRGITGLETAIVLIAFVVVSSVFAFAALSTGLFSADKSKETIHAGLGEARGTLDVKGAVNIKAVISSGDTGIEGTGRTHRLTSIPVIPGTETITSGSTTLTVGRLTIRLPTTRDASPSTRRATRPPCRTRHMKFPRPTSAWPEVDPKIRTGG